MITCSQCQKPLPKWRALFCSFRMKCPSCETELHAGKKAIRASCGFLAIAVIVFFVSLSLLEFLSPEPTWIEWITPLWVLIFIFGTRLLLWRSNDYSHQNPRFKLLGLNTNAWLTVLLLASLSLAVLMTYQSPYMRLNWQLPPETEILSDEKEVGFWGRLTIKIRLSHEEYEAFVDSLEFRGSRGKDGSYSKKTLLFQARLRFEDGIMTLEEWTN